MSRAVLTAVFTLAACGEAATTSTVHQSIAIGNGGFESGSYAPWTLLESSGTPTAGTFGIAADGTKIDAGESVFDYADQTAVDQSSPGLPITYDATEGNLVAFLLQNTAETQRMYQSITLPTCGSFVRWDMAYRTHAAFTDADQFIAVNVRAADDLILATPYKTTVDDATQVAAMTSFSVDLKTFDGMTVILDFEVAAKSNLDVAIDNIRIECDNPPIVTPSKSTLDFGTVFAGSTSSPQSVDLTNTGVSDLTITEIATLEPFAVTGPTLPITLAMGESTALTVTFSPTVAMQDPFLGAVTILSNDQNSPSLIDLVGFGTQPVLEVGPTLLDFGGQRVGSPSASRLVTLFNNGGVDVVISSITAAAPFTVVPPASLTVTSFSTLEFEVIFTPSVPGFVEQSLSIASDAPGSPTSIPLTGFGTIGSVQVQPTALVFGDVRVDLQSSAQPLTIRNLGDGPMTITAITAPGVAIEGPALPVSLLPGAEQTYEILFTPTTAGSIAGNLSIVSSAGTTTVPMAGNAVPAALVADPIQLDLGDSVDGEATNVVTVTLTNITTAPVAIASIETGGSRFVIDPAPPTTPILPGASVEFGVRFVPEGEGTVSGALQVLLQGATDGDVIIAVSGEGTLDESGCCSANGSPSSVWLALATLFMLRKSRHRERR